MNITLLDAQRIRWSEREAGLAKREASLSYHFKILWRSVKRRGGGGDLAAYFVTPISYFKVK
jgi:hypothetical protein